MTDQPNLFTSFGINPLPKRLGATMDPSTPSELVPIIDVPATLARMTAEKHKFSWSKFKAASYCQGNYVANNFAVFKQARSSTQENTASIPGTVTQLLWNAIVNEGIWRILQDPADRERWFTQNIHALIDLLVRPYNHQFDMVNAGQNIRTWFRTKAGKAEIERATLAGLDARIAKGLSLQFLDWDSDYFKRKFGTRETLERQLLTANLKSWDKLVSMGIRFELIRAEAFIQHRLGNDLLFNGGLDFTVNPTPLDTTALVNPGKDLYLTQPGYTLLDGKWTMGATLDWRQLKFYAAILQMRSNVTPRYLGFFCWSKAEMSLEPYDPTSPGYFINEARKFQQRLTPVEQWLREFNDRPAATSMVGGTMPQHQPSKEVNIYEVPHLVFSPERGMCMFCQLNETCPEAKKAGYGAWKNRESIPVVSLETPDVNI